MADASNPMQRFLARPNDDRVKVFGVAIAVALVCSFLVSIATVTLRPIQEANLAAEREARMAAMLDTLPGMRDLIAATGADTLETRMVDLSTGTFIADGDTAGFDFDVAIGGEETSVDIESSSDVAQLRRRPNAVPVHVLEANGSVQLVVLPVWGRGYKSTISALLALQADLNTVAALTILEQDETAGLGARVEGEAWLSQWPGKQVYAEDGTISISVVRGGAESVHEVDAISGATVTSNGVANMLRYWLSGDAYGPLLENMAQGDA